MTKRGATVGVAEHGNSAVLVTLSSTGELVDRRRVDLTHGLPTHPYHHEGSWAVGRYVDSPWARPTTLPEALALVDRVRAAAHAGAKAALDVLATIAPIAAVGLRACPELPETDEERIRDTRAASMADSAMYREALAAAAAGRGWSVHWYDRDRVFEEAAAAIGSDLDAALRALGRMAGPPWTAKEKLAAAAALACSRIGRRPSSIS